MEAASPVYTPAALQGEPPPWAHPTPSPSPMIRFPSGPDGMGGGKGRQEAPLFHEELLWQICTPFLQEMFLELQRVIHKEVQTLLDPRGAERSPPEVSQRPGMGVMSHGGGCLSQPDSGAPFGSLLSQGLPGGCGNRAAPRRGGSPPCVSIEPLHEVEEEHCSAREEVSPLSSPLMPGVGGGEGVPQKISFSRSSKSPSPIQRGVGQQEPAAGQPGGSHRASPALQGLEPSMQAVLLPESGTSSAPAAGPCYVMPSEQSQRLTPSVSPQIPLTHIPGYDGAGSNDLDADKSVMVCRHWKSKGWCRLENGCKFLHPENKRGTGAPPKKGSGGAAGSKEGGAQASDVGTPPGTSAAPGGDGTRSANARPSRRSGRGRSNRNQNPGAASTQEGTSPSTALAPGLVHVGGGGGCGGGGGTGSAQPQAKQGAQPQRQQRDGRNDS